MKLSDLSMLVEREFTENPPKVEEFHRANRWCYQKALPRDHPISIAAAKELGYGTETTAKIMMFGDEISEISAEATVQNSFRSDTTLLLKPRALSDVPGAYNYVDMRSRYKWETPLYANSFHSISLFPGSFRVDFGSDRSSRVYYTPDHERKRGSKQPLSRAQVKFARNVGESLQTSIDVLKEFKESIKFSIFDAKICLRKSEIRSGEYKVGKKRSSVLAVLDYSCQTEVFDVQGRTVRETPETKDVLFYLNEFGNSLQRSLLPVLS